MSFNFFVVLRRFCKFLLFIILSNNSFLSPSKISFINLEIEFIFKPLIPFLLKLFFLKLSAFSLFIFFLILFFHFNNMNFNFRNLFIYSILSIFSLKSSSISVLFELIAFSIFFKLSKKVLYK